MRVEYIGDTIWLLPPYAQTERLASQESARLSSAQKLDVDHIFLASLGCMFVR